MSFFRKGAGGVLVCSWFLDVLMGLSPSVSAASVAWVAERGMMIGGVIRPTDAVSGTDGRLYIAGYVRERNQRAVETVCLSADGETVWRALFEFPGHTAKSRMIAEAPDGSLYVGGSVWSEPPDRPFGLRESLVLKYDSDGDLLWYDVGGFYGSADHLAVMPDGGAAICGRGEPGTNEQYDIITVRYDSDGTKIWRRQWGGIGGLNDAPRGFDADPEGNLYITGIAGENYWTCPGDDEENCPASIVTLSYSPNGVLRWVDFQGTGYSCGTALRWTPDGLYVAGFLEPEPRRFAYFAALYDPETGLPSWTGRFRPEDGKDRPGRLAVAENGDALVAGGTLVAFDGNDGEVRWSSPLPVRPGCLEARPGGGCVVAGPVRVVAGEAHPIDILTSAFDAEGKVEWEDRYDGPAGGDDCPEAVAVSESGLIRVVGSSEGEYPVHERVVAAYGSDGRRLYVKRSESRIEARGGAARRVGTDGGGNIYAVGTIASDVAVIKYSPEGEEVWSFFPPRARFPEWKTIGSAVRGDRIFICGRSYRRLSEESERTSLEIFSLDFSGNLLWRRRDEENARTMAVRGDGTVFTAGCVNRGTSSSDNELMVACYDKNGERMWLTTEGKRSEAWDIAFGLEGSVFAVGQSLEHNIRATVTVGLDSEGGESWRRAFVGSHCRRTPRIRTGPGGDVWVLCTTSQDDRCHVVLLRYGPDGEERWKSEYRREESVKDFHLDFFIDHRSHAFAAMGSERQIGDLDAVVAEYDPEGRFLKEYRYQGPGGGDDTAVGLRESPSGTLWLGVSSEGIETGVDMAFVELDPVTLEELQRFRWTSEGAADDVLRDFTFDPKGDLVAVGSSGEYFVAVKFALEAGGAPFMRGDASQDGELSIADPIRILDRLFSGAPSPSCPDSFDVNDDGRINIADPVSLLSHLFGGSGPLPEPFGECGTDPTEDDLGCFAYPPCRR